MNVLSKLSVVCLFLLVAFPSDADACGNVPLLQMEQRARLVADAEERLERDLPALTVAWSQRALAYLSYGAEENRALAERARRLMAIGTVRLGGKVQPDWLPAIQRKHLREAAAVLAEQASAHPNDATLQTYLGEAYARIPDRKGEALRILTALQAQDRMVSPYGYAALARLRGEREAATGWMGWAMAAAQRVLADDARARCRAMARRPRICEA